MHYRSRKQNGVLDADPESFRNDYVAVEVRDVLARLRDDYREALVLRYAVGLSGQEAAAAMGRSHGSFRALLLRATRAFRQEFDVTE